MEELRDGLGALDASGPLGGVGTAVPGSLSSGRVGAAVSSLESRRSALAGRYEELGAGARELVATHRDNDESVARGAVAAGAAASSGAAASVSVDQWARARGLM